MNSDEFSVSHLIVDQDFHPTGHDIRSQFLLHNVACQWTFFTYCTTYPTSWKFQLNLHQFPPGSEFLLVSATLKRTDFQEVPVHASCVVTILGSNYLINNGQGFTEFLRILPGGELFKSFVSIDPYTPEHIVRLLQEGMRVTVQICIRDCHQIAEMGNNLPRPILGRGETMNSKL